MAAVFDFYFMHLFLVNISLPSNLLEIYKTANEINMRLQQWFCRDSFTICYWRSVSNKTNALKIPDLDLMCNFWMIKQKKKTCGIKLIPFNEQYKIVIAIWSKIVLEKSFKQLFSSMIKLKKEHFLGI